MLIFIQMVVQSNRAVEMLVMEVVRMMLPPTFGLIQLSILAVSIQHALKMTTIITIAQFAAMKFLITAITWDTIRSNPMLRLRITVQLLELHLIAE